MVFFKRETILCDTPHSELFTTFNYSGLIVLFAEKYHRSWPPFVKLSVRISRYLKKLNLSGNQLTIPPAALGEAAALEYLCLDNNPIQFVNHLQPFPNMSSLKEMSFCYMPHLTVIGPGSFSGMDSLEHLRIQNCPRLETIDEAAFTFQVLRHFSRNR